jgi:hypothetical protein
MDTWSIGTDDNRHMDHWHNRQWIYGPLAHALMDRDHVAQSSMDI